MKHDELQSNDKQVKQNPPSGANPWDLQENNGDGTCLDRHITRTGILSSTELGKKGEETAAAWLAEKGYQILERNWRTGRLEIDLIARKDQTIVIIEVKTRRESRHELPGRPEEAVQWKKQQHLAKAASSYLAKLPGPLTLRFDIIAIRVRDQHWLVYHQEDAFFPGF
jgi:putative endonuclease